jgi:hypothetical protein
MARAAETTAITERFDVVVYGGTAGGVAAAYAAAREGSSVVLLEPGKHIGGMATGGLSKSDFGNKYVIGGFAREMYRRLGMQYDGKRIMERFGEPHVVEAMMNAMLKETDAKLVFGSRLAERNGVITSAGGMIDRILMEDGRTYAGRVFIDCSYEGDLMAQAGVKYTIGRESIAQYGESLAGVRERTPIHQFDVKVKARDDSGKLLPEIQAGEKGETGAADKKVQAYNFRVIATQREGNKVAWPKPPGYDPARYELLAGLIEAKVERDGKPPRAIDLMRMDKIQNDKIDINNYGAFSTDYIGGGWDYPDGSYAKREEIWQDHYNYVAGFFYFLAHDERVPQPLRDEMNTWGLAADEFADSGHWPRQLYVREGRRMMGDFVMTQNDIQTSITKPDVIGMGSYMSDSHNVQRFENAEGNAENEGDMQVKVGKPYQIPYGVMLPKREQARNLLVPVCLSASHVAYSTLRMEPQYMIIGEAAGVAASMAGKGDMDVQDVDRKALTARLRSVGAIMELPEKPE